MQCHLHDFWNRLCRLLWNKCFLKCFCKTQTLFFTNWTWELSPCVTTVLCLYCYSKMRGIFLLGQVISHRLHNLSSVLFSVHPSGEWILIWKMLPDSSSSRFLGWSWAYVKWAEGFKHDLFYFQACPFIKYLLARSFFTFSPTMLTALWLLMSMKHNPSYSSPPSHPCKQRTFYRGLWCFLLLLIEVGER